MYENPDSTIYGAYISNRKRWELGKLKSRSWEEAAINAFSQTNRSLNALLTSYLYQHNAKKGNGTALAALLWAAGNGIKGTARKAVMPQWIVGLSKDRLNKPLVVSAKQGYPAVTKLLLATERIEVEYMGDLGDTPLTGWHGMAMKRSWKCCSTRMPTSS